ncbi:DMT family transporter [Brevibacillus humidisoli]|uniref:DMT family transporter n=1 Tax=Brevibacillus humidisoli TaxID=2895522 RepID=UPI001E425FF9|nr:DMT family transporter [Brevibacillus humidisoli]UFJ39083.1 DMT family transporter [Brevibacillus humidisoli]
MNKSYAADLTLFAIAFVWGATFVIVQNAIAFLDPNMFNAVRFAIAAFFLTVVLLIVSRNLRSIFSWKLVAAGVFIGFWLFGGYALQTVGLLYTSPSKAGFITGLSVVLVPLFSYLILRDAIKWPAVVGVVLAVGGLYLLAFTGTLSLNLGDLLVFGCAVCFALQIVFTGKYAPHYEALPLAIVQLWVVSVLSLLYALFFENWQQALVLETYLHADVFWGLLITSIFATAFAFLAQTALQKKTSATRVALIFALEPVFAALTAYLWIDEVLTAKQLLGCVLIFSGMILAELPISTWLASWKRAKLARSQSKQ